MTNTAEGRAMELHQDVVKGVQELPWRTRWELASDPQSPQDALAWFAVHDAEPLVQVAAITNESITPESLEAATRQVKVGYVLEALANSPRQTEQGLINLSSSGFVDVRVAVALNPSTPGWLVTTYADDPDDAVRRAAVFHSSLPWKVLRRLSRDLSMPVRVAVCERRPCAPVWMLEPLLGDRDDIVRDAAARALGLTTCDAQ